MSLENVNKGTLIIILVLTVTPFVFLGCLAYPLPFLVGLFGLLKVIKDKEGGRIRRYFLNIYWKKSLLVFVLFIVYAFYSTGCAYNMSVANTGFPFSYNSLYYEDDFPSFYLDKFVIDIFFWYILVGLIIKSPAQISRNTTILNYITLVIVLLALFYLNEYLVGTLKLLVRILIL